MITGGHAAPALAIIDSLLQSHPDCEIIFVGRKYNNQQEHSESFEYKEIYKRSIAFINFSAGRITRLFTVHALRNVLQIPFGCIQAMVIVHKNKPEVIFTFGGYLGLPIAFAGYLFNIPVYTHEQTIRPGLANKMISQFAKKTFLSFEQSKKYFSKTDTILTGNPVRLSIFDKTSSQLNIDSSMPCVYVTGGSLGSHAINVLIEQILPQLLKKYTLIHQTGNVTEFDDYNRLESFKKTLPHDVQKHYILKTHISNEDIGYVYAASDLVVSRSGANTWFELVALKKPALLIPLPWSAYDEQQKQAELLKSYKAAELFDQSGTSAGLLELIDKMVDNKDDYETAYQKISGVYKPDAPYRIIAEIFS